MFVQHQMETLASSNVPAFLKSATVVDTICENALPKLESLYSGLETLISGSGSGAEGNRSGSNAAWLEKYGDVNSQAASKESVGIASISSLTDNQNLAQKKSPSAISEDETAADSGGGAWESDESSDWGSEASESDGEKGDEGAGPAGGGSARASPAKGDGDLVMKDTRTDSTSSRTGKRPRDANKVSDILTDIAGTAGPGSGVGSRDQGSGKLVGFAYLDSLKQSTEDFRVCAETELIPEREKFRSVLQKHNVRR